MANAIKVENLSKIYRLGEIGTGTISRDIERFVKTKILKQEDPYLKIGETNERAKKGASDIVYSLKDINFEIQQGEAVGIIGSNGAGKSTLLKILSRVTSPTIGKINIKGRVASLLEVGTGFHPELTGRENIYLNGAILGMRKKEIDRKFDEILDFSGVERYITTPVKRYSSGMYVRLAFAVAAHLESEILIVDEVLAVGDAEFQKKCLGKMSEVSKGEGRTILFVSHNMAAISQFCDKSILLKNGKLDMIDYTKLVINKYVSLSNNESSTYKSKKKDQVYIEEVQIENYSGSFFHSDEILFKIKLQNIRLNFTLGLALLNSDKIKLFTSIHVLKSKKDIVFVKIPRKVLMQGKFSVDFAVFEGNVVYEYVSDICTFDIIDLDSDLSIYSANTGSLKVDCIWF